MSKENTSVADLRVEVRIQASAQAVWKALTDDISRWWPGPFYCGRGTGKPSFVMEAKPGGRMMEDYGNGEGLLWGTVVQVSVAENLSVCGMTGPAWGGPNSWFASFSLAEADGETVLTFAESCFGRLQDSDYSEKEKGWRFLLGGSLKAYAEGTEPPEWKDG